ncbi:MAG: hypothetical protein AAGI14_10870 [Pseudomonadota bacterium]
MTEDIRKVCDLALKLDRYEHNYLRPQILISPDANAPGARGKSSFFPEWLIYESRFDERNLKYFQSASRNETESWIALYATQSMVHSTGEPVSADLEASIRDGLDGIGQGAQFFALGHWKYSPRSRINGQVIKTIEPLKNYKRYYFDFHGGCDPRPGATFAGGVAAVGKNMTFCLWAEAED